MASDGDQPSAKRSRCDSREGCNQDDPAQPSNEPQTVPTVDQYTQGATQDGWVSAEEEEEEDAGDEANCGVDRAQEVQRHFTPLVKVAFASQFSSRSSSSGSSGSGSGSSSSTGRPPPPTLEEAAKPPLVLRRPTCPNPICSLWGKPVEGLRAKTTFRAGRHLMLICQCKRQVCELVVGSCIWVEDIGWGIVRSISASREEIHCQALATSFQCSKDSKETVVEILSSPAASSPKAFLLRSHHSSISWQQFGSRWRSGRALVLPESPVLLYTQPDGARDLIEVPAAAPMYDCCGCGCVDMWGSGCHNICKPAATSSSGSSQEDSCCHGAEVFRTGDWVWVAPDGDGVDECKQLGRVLSPRLRAVRGATQGKARKPSRQGAEVLLYSRRDSVENHYFKPCSGVAQIEPARLTKHPDPFTIPGVRILEEDGQEVQAPPSAEVPKVVICDLFSGCGMLSLGLEESGVGETLYAVDMCKPALETLAACHPKARTFNQDVCQFLKHVAAGEEGYPTMDSHAGQIRMIVAGPPCQGFSNANKGATEARQQKNVLMALFLSVVETLQWEYVLIENVAGLLRWDGMLESIIQVLASLGYQVRWRLVSCGCFGTASYRRRFILWAVKAGLPVPDALTPTHVFNTGGYSADAPEAGCSLADRVKAAHSSVPGKWQKHILIPVSAPLPRLTVRDVIGDLPQEAAPEATAVDYAREPVSYFARWARRSGAEQVTDHQVWGLRPVTLQRVALIPKEGQPPPEGQSQWEGACMVTENAFQPARAGDWRDLPEELQPSNLRQARQRDREKQFPGVFGRLLWGGQFSTILTNLQLNSDTTNCVLHPEADRPLTCREAARVQGIPDSVQPFHGTVQQRYRMIGNCVPVPLAAALGRELKRALQQHAAR